jgi:hypothetical protein
MLIQNSFKHAGISNSLDGLEDDLFTGYNEINQEEFSVIHDTGVENNNEEDDSTDDYNTSDSDSN